MESSYGTPAVARVRLPRAAAADMKKEPSLLIGGEISPSCSPPAGRHSGVGRQTKKEGGGERGKHEVSHEGRSQHGSMASGDVRERGSAVISRYSTDETALDVL
jgi:hypothetical protein